MPVFACGVCVLWCVRSPGGGGAIIVSPPLPRLLGWLVLTRPCGLEKRVRGGVCPMGGGRLCGGGTWLSRPHALLGGAVPTVAWCGEREKGGVLPGAVNTTPRPLLCSPTWERVPPVGAEQGVSGASGRAVVVWAGVGCVPGGGAGVLTRLVHTNSPPGGRGRRLNLACVGTLASVRAVVVWAGVGVARLPFLVVGLGLMVTISLGSVKGA